MNKEELVIMVETATDEMLESLLSLYTADVEISKNLPEQLHIAETNRRVVASEIYKRKKGRKE